MSKESDEYIAGLEQFLSSIGVGGAQFCSAQYQRWREESRTAFEDAVSTSASPDAKPE
jgi:hypothetical protein